MRYSQIIIQKFYLYASHFHKSLVSPGQLAEDVVPVDHDLLVPLAPGGHPAGLHTQALDIVSVILRLVHLVAQARLQPPNPQGAIEAGGKHEAGVEDTHTLTPVLVTLEQPEVRDVVTCQNNIRNPPQKLETVSREDCNLRLDPELADDVLLVDGEARHLVLAHQARHPGAGARPIGHLAFFL